jgi:adenosylmethionine-8-amino-7-oxononanoate aminotransferase
MHTQSMISDGDANPPVDQGNAAEHLWMHFTRMSSYATKPVPTIERGEGAYIWDINARHRVAAEGVAVREGGIATTAHGGGGRR